MTINRLLTGGATDADRHKVTAALNSGRDLRDDPPCASDAATGVTRYASVVTRELAGRTHTPDTNLGDL